MAAAFSTAGYGGDDAGGTTRDSPSLVIPAGSVVYAYVQNSDSSPAAPTGVSLDPTGTPQAFTKIGDSGAWGTFAYSTLWVLKNASSVTAVVRATWSGAQGEREVVVWVGTGIDTTTPNGTVASNTGTNNTPTATCSSTAGQLVVQFAGHLLTSGSTRTYDSPSGTERAEGVLTGTPYDGGAVQDQTAAGATTSPQWSLSAGGVDGWYSFAFALNDASSGTTVTPGAGALALAGQAPTIPTFISVPAGSLRLVSGEPQIPKHIITAGDVGDLSYVGGEGLVGGLEPPQNVQQPHIDNGSLVLLGQAPTVTVTTGSNVTATPAAGALVLAGLAPTVLSSLSASPSAGALVLAGQAPSLLQNLIAQPGTGALVLAGQAPTVLQDSVRAPGAGALVLAGQAPVLLQDNIRVPGAGALVLTGQAPSLLQNLIVQPGTGALVLDGQSPAVLNGDAKVAQPDAGTLTLAGQAPTVLAAITAAPAAGALVLVGQSPTVTTTQTAQPGAGALVLAGQSPTLSVTANVVANPLTGALVFTGLAPTVSTSDNRTAAPGAGALVLAGEAPVIPIPSPTVTPDPGALFLEGLAPGIVVSGDTLLSAKYLARRPNVRVKGLQPEPQPAAAPLAPEITNMPGTEAVVRKAQGLNLGLITAPPAAPVPPAAAPVVEVPSIGVTVPAGPPPAAPEPAPAAPAPEPAAPPAPATQDDVAALHKAILEATKVEVGAQADRVLLVLASVLEKVDDLQTKIEADAKARDLRERNMLRAKQIAERMLRDLEK